MGAEEEQERCAVAAVAVSGKEDNMQTHMVGERRNMLIHKSGVRELVKNVDKRCSMDFLEVLDRKLHTMVVKACKRNKKMTVKGEDLNGVQTECSRPQPGCEFQC